MKDYFWLTDNEIYNFIILINVFHRNWMLKSLSIFTITVLIIIKQRSYWTKVEEKRELR